MKPKLLIGITIAISILAINCVKRAPNFEVKAIKTGEMFNGYHVLILTIDSCEYIYVRDGDATWGTHKGNCKYCAKRDRK